MKTTKTAYTTADIAAMEHRSRDAIRDRISSRNVPIVKCGRVIHIAREFVGLVLDDSKILDEALPVVLVIGTLRSTVVAWDYQIVRVESVFDAGTRAAGIRPEIVIIANSVAAKETVAAAVHRLGSASIIFEGEGRDDRALSAFGQDIEISGVPPEIVFKTAT